MKIIKFFTIWYKFYVSNFLKEKEGLEREKMLMDFYLSFCISGQIRKKRMNQKLKPCGEIENSLFFFKSRPASTHFLCLRLQYIPWRYLYLPYYFIILNILCYECLTRKFENHIFQLADCEMKGHSTCFADGQREVDFFLVYRTRLDQAIRW